MNALGNNTVNDPNNLDEAFAPGVRVAVNATGQQGRVRAYWSPDEIKIRLDDGEEKCFRYDELTPIEPQGAPQSVATPLADQQHHASDETPCVASVNATESSATPAGDCGIDFSLIDNPQTPPDVPDDIRELPIWGLPTDLQRVIEDVAQGYQCNRDFVVASMFGAAATMLGKRVSSEFDNHTNYPTLWLAIVGNSSSGKTAPLSFFFKPIHTMEKSAIDVYHNEMQQWKMHDVKERGPEPKHRHHLLNDASDESVLKELAINGSVCWKCDELNTMFNSWGRYSKNGAGAIVSNILSIFNNESVSITRVASEPIYIEEPNLNIIGSIQPAILKQVMRKRGYTESGLLARFLCVFPDVTDIPDFANVRIGDDVRSIWDNTIKNLSTINGDIFETSEAKQIHVDALNRWRGMCNGQYKNLDAMVYWVRKLEIHLCRWSMVVAILSSSHTITADVMRYSIECMEYFRWCGEKVFSLIANDDQAHEPSRVEVFKLLQKWYGEKEPINQSAMANALHVSQQAISKFLK